MSSTSKKSLSPARQAPTTASRNPNLDITRALAVILVIGVHFHMQPRTGVIGIIALAWHEVGPFGVHLFFVLSGYLIGGLLFDEIQKFGQIKIFHFLIRRGFKIYPGYYLFMAYLIFFPAIKQLPDPSAAWRSFHERYSELIPNLFFVQNYIGTNPDAHTWSLAVEEHFYFLLPCLLVVLVRLNILSQSVRFFPFALIICLALRLGALSSGASLNSMLWWTHLHLDALMLGVWLCYCTRSNGFLSSWVPKNANLLLACGISCASVFYALDLSEKFRLTFGDLITYSSACLIVAGAIFQKQSRHVGTLWSKCLTWLSLGLIVVGRSSYAIYLWHVTVIGGCERVLGKFLEKSAFSPGLSWVLVATSAVVLACLLGIALTKFIEAPFLIWRDHLCPSRGKILRGASLVP